MDSLVCKGCNLSVIPIKVFGQSKKSKQWWLVTKCPRARCGFNMDLIECDDPSDSKKSKTRIEGRSFWGDELSK